jgi:NADH-quinone oxidoreductase subunit N
MTNFSLEMVPLIPEVMLAFIAMALLLWGAFSKATHGAHFAFAVVGLFGVMLAVVGQGAAFDGDIVAGYKMLVSDDFAAVMKALCLIAAMLALLLARGYLISEGLYKFEYPVLVCLATLGMMIMISANNMLTLYLGLELQSLALYVLAAFHRDSVRSSEAGLKYFVLGALASGVLLYGISLLYGFAGSLDFVAIGSVLSGDAPTGAVVAAGLVLLAMAFKLSAAPFHMWTPDVYEGAPTPVTAFFAMAPKVAAVALFIRLLYEPFVGLGATWQPALIALSFLSMFVGAFGALRQTNLKRILAYSSIGHVGFLLMGMATLSGEGLAATVAYLFFYVLMSAVAFAVLLMMRVDGRAVEHMADIAGLSRTQPAAALALAVTMFSMVGIPPLVGFFTKLYVLQAAINAGLLWLAIFGVLLSVVSAFYYIRVVRVMYFDEPAPAFDRPIGRTVALVSNVGGLLVVLGFLMVSQVITLSTFASKALVP